MNEELPELITLRDLGYQVPTLTTNKSLTLLQLCVKMAIKIDALEQKLESHTNGTNYYHSASDICDG